MSSVQVYSNRKQGRLDLSQPRWDPSTFTGRYKHFFQVCNPFTLLKSNKELDYAKDVVQRYKKGENIANLTEEDIWKQKHIYESAFHPVTEQKVTPLGRMAAQCPMNTIIMGAMLVFYKTRSEIVFWQWVNQSYNALVNMSNASDPSGATLSASIKSYIPAVGFALGSSLYLNSLVAKRPNLARFVPFGATSAANAINIPFCRQDELKNGIQLWYDGKPIAKSRKMARKAIAEVVVGRIAISMPHMVCVPLLMNFLQRSSLGASPKLKLIEIPLQFALCGGLLYFSTPMGCALFPQKTYVPVERLEPEVQEELRKLSNPKVVYYNKGL